MHMCFDCKWSLKKSEGGSHMDLSHIRQCSQENQRSPRKYQPDDGNIARPLGRRESNGIPEMQ